MKLLVLFLVGSLFSPLCFAETECRWRTEKVGYSAEYLSNLENPQNVQECFYTIKKPVVLLEPFLDGNEFQGTVFIFDPSTSEVLDSCETLTVQGLNPMDDFDQNRLDYFIRDILESGDRSGDSTTNSPKWQSYFDSKISLNCPEGNY